MRLERWFYTLPLRLRSLFKRKAVDRELDEELRYHLDRQIQQNIARGLTPEEARYAAIRVLDGVERRKEECRDARGVSLIQNLAQDFRFAGRMLRKSAGFTTIAVLSLGLGIGANSAIFQLVNALRIRSLPVASPEELAEIRIVDRTSARGQVVGRFNALTNPLWEGIRDQQRTFAGVLAWSETRFNLTTAGEKRFAEGLWVSGEFFQVLGVRPALGRVFRPADDMRGCANPGAVISYGFWQREFGGSADALARDVTLNGRSFRIIGVSAPNFFGVEPGRSFDVSVPFCAQTPAQLDRRDSWWLSAMGRLKPGFSLEQANAQLQAISPALFQSTLPQNYPPENAKAYVDYKLGAYAAPSGVSQLADRYAVPLWLLLATAGLVLLIASGNLANLLLARGNSRTKEVAVRMALGASRQRLIGQFLVESLLLAILGGSVGAISSRFLAERLFNFLGSVTNPVFLNLTPDWRVLAFMTGVSALTCILFGLIPALRTTRTAPGDAIKSDGRGLTQSRDRMGLRRALVVSQVALSLLLLVGALLFTRTLINLVTLDLGFDPQNLIIVRADLARFTHAPDQRPDVYRRILERLRSANGVDQAAQAQIVPLTGSGQNYYVKADGNDKPGLAWFNAVSDGYFTAMGSSILSGRDFTDTDTRSSPNVALVNETFVKEFLGGKNPIGVQVRIDPGPGEEAPAYEVIGVVKDAKYFRVREPAPSTVFTAARQEQPGLNRSFVIRSTVALPLLTQSVAGVLRDVSPEIAFDVQVLADRIQGLLAQERLMATVSGFFGLLATALAILGIYGVLSYLVTQRRNEIGIRMALGANRLQVVSLILREASALVGTGLVLGTLLSIAATRTAETLLFGVTPNDAVTLALAVGILGVVSGLASYLPARRAANMEPVRSLRGDL